MVVNKMLIFSFLTKQQHIAYGPEIHSINCAKFQDNIEQKTLLGGKNKVFLKYN